MADLSRRAVIAGGAALTGAGLMITKPRDKSGPRAAYFLTMQKALIDAGIATPTLVIDREKLNANIDVLTKHLPAGMGYRIVAKSLPSSDLIAHIRARSGSDRLMTFNLQMLEELSAKMPEADQLLGKPLPVAAARRYFERLPAANAAAADRVQWLVDTPRRLAQYSALAKTVGRRLRVNVELDVGLHRGGFVAGAALGETLAAIKADPSLTFAGFMGYEPHVPALPKAFGWRERGLHAAWRAYQAALEQAAERFGGETVSSLCRNAAGSPTYRYYETTEIANEISAGSCLVKPTHFDTELLKPHQPAGFIATPVIKAMDKTRMPGLEFADGVKRAWDPNYQRTIFIYGGNWLADPVDPPGLSYNKTFGRSSNQEMLNGGRDLSVRPDEFVFFRPHQSEAVFLQFGDIAVYEDGAIVGRWPVFPASA
ncbi:MAG: DSD1 family PLP-dependent enzyme [Alphaproteobacteria bacterium]|nr:DSD1 family PLP-dependent enzyme [Alphaproteobacteria bacterium]